MVAEARIRVLWCIKCLGYGGAERLLVSSAIARDAATFDVEAAFVLPSKDALVPEIEAAGVLVHRLGTGESNLDLRWMGRLRRLLLERRFDVVHFHLPYVAGLGRLVVRSLPPAVRPVMVTTEHNVWSSYPWPIRLVNRLSMPLDEYRVAVSEAVKASLPRRHQRSTEVVAHGVPVVSARRSREWRVQSRAELGVGPDEILIGTVANLRPGKGYEVLLPAARSLLDQGLPVRFAAIGVGPLEDEVASLHARLGLGRSFHLLGGRADVLRLVAGFDVFVLASAVEGRPVAVMEALALGIPVVATEVGGTPEVVDHEVNGLLVAPCSPQELTDALATLVGDAGQRERLSGAARQSGRQFDMAAAVRRIEEIYRQLAPRPHSFASLTPFGRTDGAPAGEQSSHRLRPLLVCVARSRGGRLRRRERPRALVRHHEGVVHW